MKKRIAALCAAACLLLSACGMAPKEEELSDEEVVNTLVRAFQAGDYEGMKPYIERFDIYMGQPFSRRTNCAIISFEDILTVNFTSSIVEADVERYFFRRMVRDGIHVKIESNRETDVEE